MKRSELARGPVRLRKTALSRKPPPPRSTPPGAAKAADWTAETRETVAARSRGTCEVCGQRPATDVHHRKLRRHGDHRVVNALHVDRTCHEGIHKHPKDSREFGWIVPSWQDPAEVLLLVNGNRWVRLEAAGKYRTAPEGWAA